METKVYRLKEISDIKSGKRLPAGHDFSDSITQHPYVRARDIKKGVISSKDLAYISIDTYNKIKKYIIEKGDVAITIVANIGDVGYCEDKCHGANLTENAVRLTNFKKDIVDPKYLVNFLGQPFMKSYMESLAVGAAQAKLGIYKIEKIKIPLPSLATQQKISSILSTYDSQIENNQKRIKLLEQMAENLYKEWFVRFRFPGYENAEFEGGVPKGWEYKPLGEIVSFERGLSYSSEEIDCEDGLNLVNLKNIEAFGGYRRDGLKHYNGKYKTAQIVKKGDLVMGVTDMTQDRRTVGAVALIPDIQGVSVISADLVKVTSKQPNLFLYCLCRYGNYSKYFSQFANGANVLHLKPNTILNKKVLLPNDSLVRLFAEKVKGIIDCIDDLYKQNDLLTTQRDLLLPRLMSGKINI